MKLELAFSFPFVKFFAILVSLIVAGGCGSKGIDKNATLLGMQELEKARQSYSQTNFEAVLSDVEKSIASGGLHPELFCEAAVLRAKALIRLKRFDEAWADINLLDSISNDLSIVYGLKYLFYSQKGEASKAQDAWREALRINPAFKVPQ